MTVGELYLRRPRRRSDANHAASRRQFYRLRGERYVGSAASVALEGIDLEQLETFLHRPTTSQAIRDYRAALRPAAKP